MWFRDALADTEQINNLSTGEADLAANAAVAKEKAAEEVRHQIAEQLGDAFDNLVMAATAKNDTINQLTKSIGQLTATNTTQNKRIEELLVENESLKEQIRKISQGHRNSNCNQNRGNGNTNGGGNSNSSGRGNGNK